MRRFGLIGFPLTHSFSKDYFSSKFRSEGLEDVSYVNYPLEKIEDLSILLESEANLKGLNVTIPFKESVIPFLDEIDHSASEIGAVNTLKLKDGKIKGYNTDIIGFRESIKPFLAKEHSRALIFGTGGSSKAVAYILKKLDIPFFYVSRTPSTSQCISYNDLDDVSIKSFRLLINCTPIGMYPQTEETLPISFEGITKQHLVYDLIYNPEETLFLKKAKEMGAITVNGLSMLKIQAEASWAIWNNEG